MKWRMIPVVVSAVVVLLSATWSLGDEPEPESSAQSTYTLRSSVISGGGGATQTSGFRQLGTLAQPTPAGDCSGPGYALQAGFAGGSGTTATGIDDGAAPSLANRLHQNYPNPFNPTTTIEYTVAHTGLVEITIYDVRGKRVQRLVNESRPAGMQRATWDGTTDQGNHAASGVYFYRLRIGTFTDVKKMVLLK